MADRRYLIDTHCWLWWHIDPARLSQAAFDIIEDASSEIFFSVVSAWEISIKHGLKKLTLPLPPEKYVPSRLQQSYMAILPIGLEHSLQVGRLPPHHRDPFDRLLITQAVAENLTIITHDSQFSLYDIDILY